MQSPSLRYQPRSAWTEAELPIKAGGLDLLKSDGVLVRMMPPGSLEQVVFRMDALHRVAAQRVSRSSIHHGPWKRPWISI